MPHPISSGLLRYRCIVCSRHRRPACTTSSLNELNRRLGEELLADGRVYAGTTIYGGRVALRPAITNWRTSERDVDFFIDVVRELGAGDDRSVSVMVQLLCEVGEF